MRRRGGEVGDSHERVHGSNPTGEPRVRREPRPRKIRRRRVGRARAGFEPPTVVVEDEDVFASTVFGRVARHERGGRRRRNRALPLHLEVQPRVRPQRARRPRSHPRRAETKTTAASRMRPPTPRGAGFLRASRTFRIRAATRAPDPSPRMRLCRCRTDPPWGRARAERRERLAASHGFACECESCVDVRADATPPDAFAVDARLAAPVDDARAALERVAGSNPTGEREGPGNIFFPSTLREPREALVRAIDACRRPSRGFPPLARSLGEAEDCAARLLVASGDVAGAAIRARRALASVEASYPRDALAPAMDRARVAA